ncbi:23S rRNA (adenine(2058)-N(6))-methyltransferase Erm(37) [soil metagenome]
MVAGAGIGRGELVLEVGAGTGALTAPLVEAGARVIAVELHPGRAAELQRRFPRPPVTVVRTDAADLRLPRRPFRVVANPPFGITTALLRRLLSPGSRLVRADLIVPYHVAIRWTGPGAPGAARWRHTFAASFGGQVPRTAFRPPAPGRTALLVVSRPRSLVVRYR